MRKKTAPILLKRLPGNDLRDYCIPHRRGHFYLFTSYFRNPENPTVEDLSPFWRLSVQSGIWPLKKAIILIRALPQTELKNPTSSVRPLHLPPRSF